ncbi:MAG: hypothetical protein JWO25_882 [Alphaproteobacteria bacterium]|nr:hypothetical protein [Alphaproteobacteria bacterium]
MRKALIGILMAATVATPLAAQDNQQNWRHDRGEARSENRGDRGERGGGRQQREQAQPAQQAAPQQAAPQQQAPQQQRQWSRGQAAGGQRQQWQGNQAQAGQWQGNRGQGAQSTLDTQGVIPRYQRQGERNQQRYGNGNQAQGNWSQNGRRDDRYRDDRRDNGRNWNNNGGNWGNDRGSRQSYSWNRGWRNDNRYDWQRYRYSNRNQFRGGSYYAPYRNYRYNRLGIGGVLDSLFFGRDYWIDNPYDYRLPASPPGTQWVRYYNDVVLVDVYSGEVIDVIYDFFW